MKHLASLLAIGLLLPALSLADDTTAPRIIDADGPAQGSIPLELRELWRVGGDDDEDVLFGVVVDVLTHDNGDVYVLDYQLCQVVVISEDGEFLRYLSREGDGPGELRQPISLAMLDDDVLAVGVGFPGKLVTLKPDGTPISSIYPIGVPAEGNLGVLISSAHVDGVLVTSGARIVFENDGQSHTQRFLSVADEGFETYNRILERNTPINPGGNTFVEAANYYIDRRWALGPDGHIFAPMLRDSYEISVFDRTGALLRTFGRSYQPRKRTQAEKDEVSPMINVNNGDQARDWDICDYDECVDRIQYNHDDGTVWVLAPDASDDRPDEVLEIWDVFSAEGEYLREAPILLGDQMNNGACYLIGGGRMIVVRGASDAFGPDEEDEIEPVQVICYEIL